MAHEETHVQEETHGFRMEPLEIARDLGLRESFRGDVLLVSEGCEHGGRSDQLEVTHACRGVIKDVAHSTIAERAGATRYLNASPRKQRKMRKRANHCCAYCRAPLFRLRQGVIFKTEEEYFDCIMLDAKFYEVRVMSAGTVTSFLVSRDTGRTLHSSAQKR
eukprot:TRINITY_DN5744_c0_g2_i1.p1 TRINITY_DN5744_c0_g2~~TRINITY_DN5744_c0_g2_i1.p1  ORF type:complete len:188 (-),score=0.55 TRINITY_DN5744_c0_g2_i1:12-497(-)